MSKFVKEIGSKLITAKVMGVNVALENEVELCKHRVSKVRKERGSALKEELMNLVLLIAQFGPLLAFIIAAIALGIAWGNGKLAEVFK